MKRSGAGFVAAVVVAAMFGTGVGRADFVLYVSDPGTNDVDKVSSTGVVSVFATGFNNPQGLALDSNGNLYVANKGTNQILVVPPSGGASTVFASVASPYGLAFDASGNLLVASGTTIEKVNSQGTVSNFFTAANGNNLRGLAVDSSGNVYAASTFNGGAILQIPSGGGSSSNFGGSPNAPIGLAFSGSNLYFASGGNGVYQATANNSQLVNGTSSIDPYGLSFDGNGNLFVVNLTAPPTYSTATIDEIAAGSSTATNFLTSGSVINPSFILVQGSLAAVPEPSTLALSAVAALAAAVYLRRRAKLPLTTKAA